MNGFWAHILRFPATHSSPVPSFVLATSNPGDCGIEKINRECHEHGIDPSLYDSSMSGLMLTFQANPAHLPATPHTIGVKEDAEKTPVETRVETPDRIVELLRAHPHLTLAEVAAQLDVIFPRNLIHAGQWRIQAQIFTGDNSLKAN